MAEPSWEDLARIAPVSRETWDGLRLLISELQRWQAVKNLVGPSTLAQVWERHVIDSLQLLAIEPERSSWLDLGSGAGFPGLVLGIAAREKSGMHVHLVESNGRKCAFLRHVARLTQAPVTVYEARLQQVIPAMTGQVDVVTARALASLPDLIGWCRPLLTRGAIGLFPKGRDAGSELTRARESWRFQADVIPSRTDAESRIIRILSVEER